MATPVVISEKTSTSPSSDQVRVLDHQEDDPDHLCYTDHQRYLDRLREDEPLRYLDELRYDAESSKDEYPFTIDEPKLMMYLNALYDADYSWYLNALLEYGLHGLYEINVIGLNGNGQKFAPDAMTSTELWTRLLEHDLFRISIRTCIRDLDNQDDLVNQEYLDDLCDTDHELYLAVLCEIEPMRYLDELRYDAHVSNKATDINEYLSALRDADYPRYMDALLEYRLDEDEFLDHRWDIEHEDQVDDHDEDHDEDDREDSDHRYDDIPNPWDEEPEYDSEEEARAIERCEDNLNYNIGRWHKISLEGQRAYFGSSYDYYELREMRDAAFCEFPYMRSVTLSPSNEDASPDEPIESVSTSTSAADATVSAAPPSSD